MERCERGVRGGREGGREGGVGGEGGREGGGGGALDYACFGIEEVLVWNRV